MPLVTANVWERVLEISTSLGSGTAFVLDIAGSSYVITAAHLLGYHLTAKAMEWFWDAYAPDPDRRSEITASPNQATVDQLRELPPAFIAVDEADILRDEGEAYAAKLRAAGVPVTTVRYRRHDPRLHDGQPADRDERDARRRRAGDRVLRGALD
jgi:acetyl esterase